MGKLIIIILFFPLLFACDEAKFSQQESGKATPERQPTGQEANPALPNTPESLEGPWVNCTSMTEEACHNEKENKNSNRSYRDVDCSQSRAPECEKLVNKAISDDGVEESEIRVKACIKDDKGTCQAIDNKSNGKGDVIVTEGSKVGDNGGIDINEGEIRKEDVGICVGGPVQPSYPFGKTPEEQALAQACLESTRLASQFNPAASACQRSAQIKPCHFTDDISRAKDVVKKTLPGQCVCLTTAISAVPGLQYDY